MPTLDWLDREQAMRVADAVPYRMLEPVSVHGDPAAQNLLIQGDNLEALKALLPFYRGRVKCIYIDPPYNTKSAFEHYDDNLEHSQWLTMIYPRLVLLRELLSEDGSIWLSIDDNEGHYLKVVADEVFGRNNFVANVVWEKSDSPKMDSQYFSSRHDHILVYARSINKMMLHRISVGGQAHYNRKDESGRKFYTKPLRAMGSGEDTRAARPSMFFPLKAPDGTDVFPIKPDGAEGRWRWSKEKVNDEFGRIEWVSGRNGWTPYYRIFEDTSSGRPPETIWPHAVVGTNRTSKAEVKALLGEVATFTTPKPEALLANILSLATTERDIVLDSFLGSGTTAAVAQKMQRRFIGIEMGEHAATHCLPRLEKVIAGEQGGISQAVDWKGGGGFRFLRLGDSIFDELGSINQNVRFATLAAFIWMQEAGVPATASFESPMLGIHEGVAYYLLYNGILGDKRPESGNVLTGAVLKAIHDILPHDGPKVVYGEGCSLGAARLAAADVTFKHIPYDVKAR